MLLVIILAVLAVIVMIALIIKDKIAPKETEKVDEAEVARQETERLLRHDVIKEDRDDE